MMTNFDSAQVDRVARAMFAFDYGHSPDFRWEACGFKDGWRRNAAAAMAAASSRDALAEFFGMRWRDRRPNSWWESPAFYREDDYRRASVVMFAMAQQGGDQ